MPITLNDDKLEMYKILSTDPYIKSLGFAPDKIYRWRYSWDVMTEETKQIFIFNMQPEMIRDGLFQRLIFQIDVNVPFADYNSADLAGDQIIALLHEREIGPNFHRLRLYSAPMVLTSPPNYYSIGIRFSSSESVANKIKKS